MDYEKKYKEALEQAKKELATCGSMDCDAARLILRLFPQLRESEDERIRKEIIDFVDTTTLSTDERHHRWIAYLEKQKEQKQEWSEEDDEMLEYVIGDLNDAKQLFSAKDAIDLCDKEIAWLKSLPMRCPKSSDNWKPSEEQMKALEAATVRYQSTGLESLYEELKKL